MFWKKKEKSKIVVHYDAGFPNNLYLRGEGIPGLSWEKGQKMKNISPHLWQCEFQDSFNRGKFKILINDKEFEEGEDHFLKPGQIANIYPRFRKK